VNASSSVFSPSTESVKQVPVAGYATMAMAPEQVPALRRCPGQAVGAPISPSLLKYADPQAVAALAVVLQAIQDHDLAQVCFRDWGVIAGPSLLGRQASVDSLARYREEGAFGISPHLIPYESLHAVSGTISQVLRIHGPNFGVGGGPSAAEEALLVAATLVAQGGLPGLWVVLTEFDPELIPAAPGQLAGSTWTCHAVAMALMPAAANAGFGLRIAPPPPVASGPQFRVSALREALATPARPWSCRLSSGLTVSLQPWPVPAERRCA